MTSDELVSRLDIAAGWLTRTAMVADVLAEYMLCVGNGVNPIKLALFLVLFSHSPIPSNFLLSLLFCTLSFPLDLE